VTLTLTNPGVYNACHFTSTSAMCTYDVVLQENVSINPYCLHIIWEVLLSKIITRRNCSSPVEHMSNGVKIMIILSI